MLSVQNLFYFCNYIIIFKFVCSNILTCKCIFVFMLVSLSAQNPSDYFFPILQSWYYSSLNDIQPLRTCRPNTHIHHAYSVYTWGCQSVSILLRGSENPQESASLGGQWTFVRMLHTTGCSVDQGINSYEWWS